MTQTTDTVEIDAAGAPASSNTRGHLGRLRAKQKEAAVWLKQVARPQKTRLRLASAAASINGILAIPQAFLLASIIINVLRPVDGATVLLDVALLILVFFLRAGFGVLREMLGFEAAVKIKTDVRRRLTRTIALRPPGLRGRHHSGGLASIAIEQIDALEGYYKNYLPQSTASTVVPLCILIVVTPLFWPAGLVLTIAGSLIPLAMALVGMQAAARSAHQFQSLTRMSGYFLDRLQGLTTLNLFGQGAAEAKRIGAVADDFRRHTMGVLRVAFLTTTALEFFSVLAFVVVIALAGWQTLDPDRFEGARWFTSHTALFLLLLVPEFFQPLRQLGAYYHDRTSAVGAAESLKGLADWEQKPAVTSNFLKPAAPPGIVISGLTVSYTEERSQHLRRGLKDLSMTVKPGETVAIVGPSGTGKSTLLNTLLGYVEPQHGSIKIGDQELTPNDGRIDSGLFAWVGQRAHVFHGTLADNIRLGDWDATHDDVWAAARDARALEFIEQLPDGFETVVGERGFGLSGGQIQRVALARAFLSGAPVLLLDEPTAHLDEDNEILIADALAARKGRQTTLIATHGARIQAMADHVVTLSAGQESGDG